MRINLKTTTIHIPESNTVHVVEFEASSHLYNVDGQPSKLSDPVVIARTGGIQERTCLTPNPASLATSMLRELERAVADLRAEMRLSGLLDLEENV